MTERVARMVAPSVTADAANCWWYTSYCTPCGAWFDKLMQYYKCNDGSGYWVDRGCNSCAN
ncbi:hypothetical protein ACGFNU_32320 [Spirillospora sp. NPDC048911]|uniref:hypothetical protein n=1 Tax=Spirillospora sp. NPDC048911 TaxID=3364527 RepID=UPI003715AAB0